MPSWGSIRLLLLRILVTKWVDHFKVLRVERKIVEGAVLFKWPRGV